MTNGIFYASFSVGQSYLHSSWILNLEVKAEEGWCHVEGQPDVPLVRWGYRELWHIQRILHDMPNGEVYYHDHHVTAHLILPPPIDEPEELDLSKRQGVKVSVGNKYSVRIHINVKIYQVSNLVLVVRDIQ